MINKKDFYNNFSSESNNLGMFCISFDNSKSDYILENEVLPLDNEVSDLSTISAKLFNLIIDKIDNFFICETYKKTFKIFPKWIMNNFRARKSIYDYLRKLTFFPTKAKIIKINEKNLEQFFIHFLNYPFKYQYQDLYLFSKNKPIIFVISHHGSFWVISKDFQYLKEIYKIFKSEFELIILDTTFKAFLKNEPNTTAN